VIREGLRWQLRTGLLGFFRELLEEIKCLPKRNHSQFNEQAILSHILTESNGFYVDIGAGRPVSGSNTFFLYRKGWSGICIDPIRNNQILHNIFRPRDIFLPILCGEESVDNFYLFNPYVYSTTRYDVMLGVLRRYGSGVKLISKRKVESILLKLILQQHQVPKVDFLNIDTEGSDLDILMTIDWSQCKPSVIAVEAWSEAEGRVKEFLALKGYEFLQACGPTLIFRI
jgi:hypothetical protein